MKKRRAEIAVLAALILLAAAGRPSIGFSPAIVQVGDLAPQRIATAHDLGVIAIKVLATWIDRTRVD